MHLSRPYSVFIFLPNLKWANVSWAFPSPFGFPLLHILPDGQGVSSGKEFFIIIDHLVLTANDPTSPCHLQEPWDGVKWQMSHAWQTLEEGERHSKQGEAWLVKDLLSGGCVWVRENLHTSSGDTVCLSILECVAAGHFDRCRTCVITTLYGEEDDWGKRGTSMCCKMRWGWDPGCVSKGLVKETVKKCKGERKTSSLSSEGSNHSAKGRLIGERIC